MQTANAGNIVIRDNGRSAALIGYAADAVRGESEKRTVASVLYWFAAVVITLGAFVALGAIVIGTTVVLGSARRPAT